MRILLEDYKHHSHIIEYTNCNHRVFVNPGPADFEVINKLAITHPGWFDIENYSTEENDKGDFDEPDRD